MVEDVKELLRLFGIPYIDAPAEAEAQCAFLNQKGLVDGVISNDSDVFLFGAVRVYRNVFDQKRYVEKYDSSYLESGLGLSRERLIILAMLLGSDYTDGVNGIGIVNALEILSAFPNGIKGLEEFRDWILLTTSSDSLLPSRKKYSDESKYNSDLFKYNHRNIKSQWQIPDKFPSEEVLKSYLDPAVDKSEEPFSWGDMNFVGLYEFCKSRIGWSDQETHAKLDPLQKKSNSKSTSIQTRIDQYFTARAATDSRNALASVKSTRLKNAINQLIPKNDSEPIKH
jgi:DNA excision repair protein ERCC-5